ncbi:MAG: hypothetical protein C4523_17485 [Myxococcales bacterium]|nr:MAG: hypothetical protein C4523_17485 [Myxococcales bacterium]
MSEITAGALGEIGGRILEDAAFVFTEPTDEPPAFEEAVLEGRLRFVAPSGEGTLLIAAGRSLAQEIAANLLGVDAGDPETDGQDRGALGEMLNIIAGAFMADRFGHNVLCMLGIPSVQAFEPDAYAVQKDGTACKVHFSTDDGRRIDLGVDFVERSN